MMIAIRIVVTSGRKGLPGGEVIKNPPANAGDREMQVQSLGREDPLEEEMATHSSILIAIIIDEFYPPFHLM